MKKKISAILAVSMITTNVSPVINVYANDVVKEKARIIEQNVVNQAKITSFNLNNYSNYEDYNNNFRVLRDEIKSISNNGGRYASSSIEKAIDGNISTHWETGKPNSSDFKNEVVVEFKDVESIDRIAYATRQDSAKGKGYPTKFEIYSSVTGNDEDFKLVSTGEHSATGNMMEFKFDTIATKKIKFVFKEAHNDWASASEFWFYKEDKTLNTIERLFKDSNMNEVSDEFKSPENFKALEDFAKQHPFYENFKEDIENAKKILENNEVSFSETKVSKLLGYGTENEQAYNNKYMLGKNHIINTEVNGGTYPTTKIEYMYDNNPNTHWETNQSNSSSFTNEVTFTFDEIQNLDRVALLPRSGNQKGFPTNYEIYASETSKGNTFKLVSSGTAKVTKDFMQFKFNPTNFKRLKFVFKECHENRPFISEARFYKEDVLSEKIDKLFTDSNKNTVSPDFGTLEKLTALENEAKAHPLYSQFKEDLDDAKLVLEGNEVTYADAKVSKFKAFGTPELAEYDKTYKIDNSHIKNITTNGRHWSNQTIDKAIDGDPNTNWHSDARNSETHTNEVIMTLDQIRTLDRIVYYSPRDRGFAEKFDIYTSKTSAGDTFTKVTSGSASRTGDSISIKFNPTQAKRVKFVYKQGYEGWALASEFGLYTQDVTMDKMDRLFTDNTMSALSEEFNSIDKLNALEEECKKHPFYNDFKEDLENARNILEQEEIVSGVAFTKSFTHLDNKEYIEQFRIPYENIKSITNNAGRYSSQTIDKAADNDINTYWETNKSNDTNWSNEVTVEFVNPVTIDRLAYGARQSDAKGFAQEFEIYGSTTSKGETFKLVATGKANKTKDLIEAKFQPTKFKRIKLKWTKGDQNWATLNEIMFFRKDAVSDKVNDMFTDGLMSELKDKYKSLEAIESLEKEVMKHPLKDSLMPTIELAKKVLNGEQTETENMSRTLVGEQRGNFGTEGAKRSINGGAYTSLESFGRYVTPGEEIIVYVDADPTGKMPQLGFGQVGKTQGNWRRTVNLHPGRNVVKAPTDMNCAAVYLINEAYPEEQAYAPKVRFEGGTKFPTYFHGETDPKEFAKELEEYERKVAVNDEDFVNGNPKGKVYNIAEFVSENVVITTTAKGALKGIKQAEAKGYDSADTMEGWEEIYDMFQSFMGFEENAKEEKDSLFPNKFVARAFQGGPHAYAAYGYTGYRGSDNIEKDEGFFKLLAMPPQMPGNDNWAYNHEFGHIFNTKHIVHGEVTNNLYAQEYRRLHPGTGGDRANWNEVLKRFKGEEYNLSHFENLAILSQLNIAYGYDAYTKASKAVRDNTDLIKSIKGSDTQRLTVAYSLGLGVNLMDFFEGWKYVEVTPQMREAVAQLPKPDKKIEYLHGGAYDYKGTGFSEDVKVTVSSNINKEDKTNTLKFNIDTNNSDDLLGYEILKDGEVIGYTKDSSFVVKNIDIEENAKYDVVAYAKDLSTAKPVSTEAFQPIVKTVGGLTLGLREEFNPLDYVKATDYEGNDLRDIKVVNNVDNTKAGVYDVVYEVSDKGSTTRETMKVTVASAYDYLSDREWDSVKTDWGTPSRNNSIKGRTLGEIKDYDKGIRLHANGNVVYDLGEHNYEEFEVKVGVDMNIPVQNNSSITFKVVGDGKTLATTKVMKHADDLQYIKVPIKGVKELRLEVNNGGNGNTSDHGIFVEPKLTTNNAKPELTIPKSQTVKVGQTLDDLAGTYKATDAEDGNITGSVVVTGQDKVNFNRVGNYPIVYTVTDRDGNKTEKNRTISVVNPEDFRYLSDYDWKSATSGYGGVKKDKSISNNKIRLNGEDGSEVVYTKGLGTHAHSEIVYDLTDKNVNMFSSFVGVDRQVYNRDIALSFEVHLDGEKIYDSGVMKAKDAHKFVEVDTTGAKQLKLIVRDGGNGTDYDHANWADAKLYFVNTDRVDTTELTKTIEEAKKVDKDNYTEDSVKVLEDKLAKAEALLKEEKPSQEAIDNMTIELQDSVKDLIEINLQEVVNIPDKYLVKSIQNQLGKTENITLGDMRSLTTLRLSGVVDLTGIEHARNLETLEMSYNEVKDLRPLANLKKLKTLDAKEQIIAVGELTPSNGKVVVDSKAYNREGKNVAKTVKLVDKDGNTVIEQDAKDESVISIEGLSKGLYGVHVLFEDEDFDGIMIYLFNIN